MGKHTAATADPTTDYGSAHSDALCSTLAENPSSGGVLAALRRSPLVGSGIDLKRPRDEGRKVDL